MYDYDWNNLFNKSGRAITEPHELEHSEGQPLQLSPSAITIKLNNVLWQKQEIKRMFFLKLQLILSEVIKYIHPKVTISYTILTTISATVKADSVPN
jgi:hypothetical protein